PGPPWPLPPLSCPPCPQAATDRTSDSAARCLKRMAFAVMTGGSSILTFENPRNVALVMDNPDISKLAIDRAATPARRRRRRWWPWLAGAAVLAAVGFVAYGRFVGGPPTVETAAVSAAYPSQAVTLLNATGYVVAQRKAAVASKATGRLEWLGVMEGSRVKRDEVIARIENRDVAASRDQAKANVGVAAANLEQAHAEAREAQANLARSRDLAEKKYISGSTLDSAVARDDKARAGVRSGEAALAAAQANLDAAESSLGRVKLGQPCEIQLDALPEQRVAGVVQRVVPTVDRAKATVLVKIRFIERDPRVVPDMAAKVAFLERELAATERKPVPAVPKSALLERDGAKYVFVVKDGRAQRVKLDGGRALGDLVQADGLTPGERVIVKPPERLADGARVK